MAAIARVDDRTSCDAIILQGSDNVFVNGKKVARIDDKISCGAIILQGSDNVFAR